MYRRFSIFLYRRGVCERFEKTIHQWIVCAVGCLVVPGGGRKLSTSKARSPHLFQRFHLRQCFLCGNLCKR
jgi:hypothetical protein